MAAPRRVGREAAEEAGRAVDQRPRDRSAALCRGPGEGLPAERRAGSSISILGDEGADRNRGRGRRRDLALLRPDDRQADRHGRRPRRAIDELGGDARRGRGLAGADQRRLPVQRLARSATSDAARSTPASSSATCDELVPDPEPDDDECWRGAAVVRDRISGRRGQPLADPRQAFGFECNAPRQRRLRSQLRRRVAHRSIWTTSSRWRRCPASAIEDGVVVFHEGQAFEFALASRGTGTSHGVHDGEIEAPMPGQGDGGRGFGRAKRLPKGNACSRSKR